MNTRQSVVLIAGAIVVIIVLFTAPEVYLIPSSSGHLLIRYDSPPSRYLDVKPTVDLSAALLRIVCVIGATLLVCYAVKHLPEGPRPHDMNIQKGLFRLTLVVSILAAIIIPLCHEWLGDWARIDSNDPIQWGFLALATFASTWLAYLFIRWVIIALFIKRVIIAYIVGGFKSKP